MTAYCLKCRAKKEISRPENIVSSNGTPMLRGKCPDCGGMLFRMLKREAKNEKA